MQLILTMAGRSARYRREGFDRPKPLIDVLGQPMFAHVLGMFPSVLSPIVVISREQDLAHSLSAAVLRHKPMARVVLIDAHNDGPAVSIYAARDLLDIHEPVALCYVDFCVSWQEAHFAAHCRASRADAIVVGYCGAHPHLRFGLDYGWMQHEDGRVTRYREKDTIVSDPVGQGLACSAGLYWFRSAGKMVAALGDLLEDPSARVGGEYYPSTAIGRMVDAGDPVDLYVISNMMQWGTPQDLRDFLYDASNYAHRQIARPVPQHNALVLLPAAGDGSRFYGKPKAKIAQDVDGMPMAFAALRQLGLGTPTVIGLRRDLVDHASVAQVLSAAFPETQIYFRAHRGLGQADTISWLLSQCQTDPAQAVIVGVADAGLGYDVQAHQRALEAVDVLVWVTRGHPPAVRTPSAFGWVDVSDGLVTRVRVKSTPENPAVDAMIVGVISVATTGLLQQGLARCLARDARVQGEFYLDAVIEDLLALGARVGIFEVDRYDGWGTPSELAAYHYWQRVFAHWPPTAKSHEAPP